MGLFRLKACKKCRGDLFLEEGDWLCLQCGTYYYTRLYHRPKPNTSYADNGIGPESAPPSWGKGREKALASDLTLVMPDTVGLPPVGRFSAGIVGASVTGTVTS